MLDINFIKENKELVKKAAQDRGLELDLGGLLELDQKRRELIAKVDNFREQRNIAAQEKNIEKGRKIKKDLDQLEDELKIIQKQFEQKMLEIPNMSVEGVPEGDESHNQIIKKEGKPASGWDFPPKDHVELGEILEIIDIPRAAKVSGARFAYLKNEGALLELALVQFAMENLVKAGFTPLIPPALIKKEMTEGLGYWHGGGNENYYLVKDYQKQAEGSQEGELDLYLIGTGEHATVVMHSEETFCAEELPQKYAAFSPCFRREAGSYGKDTRGILRVHQFDKVEMVKFVRPEDDEKERREMLSLAEGLMKALGLPYQVVKLASGELGFPSAETIDIETWIPSQNRYRETHSISTTTDFQARRLNIRYRKKNGGTGYVHILNGTALAIGRTIICILENYQQKDGSVLVPKVLQKYTGFEKIAPKK